MNRLADCCLQCRKVHIHTYSIYEHLETNTFCNLPCKCRFLCVLATIADAPCIHAFSLFQRHDSTSKVPIETVFLFTIWFFVTSFDLLVSTLRN